MMTLKINVIIKMATSTEIDVLYRAVLNIKDMGLLLNQKVRTSNIFINDNMYMNSQFFKMLKKATKPLFVTLFIRYHLKLYVAYKYLDLYVLFCLC